LWQFGEFVHSLIVPDLLPSWL